MNSHVAATASIPCAWRWSACRIAARPRCSIGSREAVRRVANYAGVTVERKEGSFVGPTGQRLYKVLDLPGAYSLTPTTLDEAITRDFLLGRLSGRTATRVRRLRGRRNQSAAQPAAGAGIARTRRADARRAQHERPCCKPRLSTRSCALLEQELGVPVVETIAVDHRRPCAMLVDKLEGVVASRCRTVVPLPGEESTFDEDPDHAARRAPHPAARSVTPNRCASGRSRSLDALVMHPIAGPVDSRDDPLLRVPGRLQLG
jgi:ferrous iron transport protein B